MSREDFICTICRRNVTMRWNYRRGREEIIPPICLGCERDYSRGIGKAVGGSFRDRREVTRGFAVAEALACEAGSMMWRQRYG